MLLTGPSMARTLTATGAAEAASGDEHALSAASARQYGDADAEVPDLSEASEPDGARGSDSDADGEPKISNGSPSVDAVAQNNTIGRAGDTVRRVGVQTPSDGPSTGPSTPTGHWLEPQQLERERWVSEDAAFNDPGAWGAGDGGALLGGSDAPASPRVGHAALDIPSPGLLPAPGHGGSVTAGINAGPESPVTVSRILADSTPVTAASDARPLPPILVPPKAPDALGEAAAHAMTLPGRPGARPAQQESNGHLRRGRSPGAASVDGARAEGRLPAAQQERRHSLPAMPFSLSVRPLDSVAEVRLLILTTVTLGPLISEHAAGQSACRDPVCADHVLHAGDDAVTCHPLHLLVTSLSARNPSV